MLTAVENQDVGLVIDLSDVSYMDSAGVNLLFDVAERLTCVSWRPRSCTQRGGSSSASSSS